MMNFLMPPNFRDLGGLKCTDGRRVKCCRLLRSGTLAGLPQETIKHLTQTYQLMTIVDLRGDQERMKSPDPVLKDVAYIVLDLLKNIPAYYINLEDLLSIPDVAMVDNYMLDVYRMMMTDPLSCRYFKKFFNVLMQQEEGSLLFHCFAGKDRTGVAAALTLSVLGISREEIIADYLLTNQLNKSKNESIIEIAAAKGATKHQLAFIEATLGAHVEYLLAALDTITYEGSINRFMTDTLGITEGNKKKLQCLYLE